MVRSSTSGPYRPKAPAHAHHRPSLCRLIPAFSLALLGLWCLPGATLAAENTFGGEGHGLVPAKDTRIAVRSLHVTIATDSDAGPWNVLATYLLENTRPHTVALQMAFPERLCAAEEECTTRSKGQYADVLTTARGQTLQARAGRIEQDRRGNPKWVPASGRVWLYDLSFEAKETLEVVHKYTMEAPVDATGRSLDYVTLTLRHWHGNVGKATFVIRLPSRPYAMRWPISYKVDGDTEKRDSQGNLRTEIVFEMRNWKPMQDLRMRFGSEQYDPLYGRCPNVRAVLDAASAEEKKPGYLHRVLTMRTDEDLRLCRNHARARHGYPFDTKELHRFFYDNEAVMKRVMPELGFDKRKHRVRGMSVNGAWSEQLLSADELAYAKAIEQEEKYRTGIR